MPNICAAMNASFTGVAPSGSCSEEERTGLVGLFSLVGSAELTEERNLDALTSLTGAGPAFFLSLLEAAAMGDFIQMIVNDINVFEWFIAHILTEWIAFII